MLKIEKKKVEEEIFLRKSWDGLVFEVEKKNLMINFLFVYYIFILFCFVICFFFLLFIEDLCFLNFNNIFF